MKKKEEHKKGRREFLKGSLVAGAAGLLAGITGAAPKIAEGAPASKDKASQDQASPEGTCKKYSFETPPAPIPAGAIKTKKSVDIVVLGAGLSGLCAAYSAADKGAKVVLFEKRKTFTMHGGWNAAVGDRLHKAQGADIPRDEVMADIMRFGAYHPNARLIKLWIDESGRVMDKLLDMADAAGVKYSLNMDIKSHWPYKEFPLSVNFWPGMNFTLGGMLEKYIKAKGVEILYETPAVQLIRKDKKSRVTGVIAKGKDGYVQVDAAKGVIICTGCYGSNREMLEKYSPRALKTINNQYAEGSNTGDGIIMGMWAGGAKQETDCPMLWDGMIPGKRYFCEHYTPAFFERQFVGRALCGRRCALRVYCKSGH